MFGTSPLYYTIVTVYIVYIYMYTYLITEFSLISPVVSSDLALVYTKTTYLPQPINH